MTADPLSIVGVHHLDRDNMTCNEVVTVVTEQCPGSEAAATRRLLLQISEACSMSSVRISSAAWIGCQLQVLPGSAAAGAAPGIDWLQPPACTAATTAGVCLAASGYAVVLWHVLTVSDVGLMAMGFSISLLPALVTQATCKHANTWGRSGSHHAR